MMGDQLYEMQPESAGADAPEEYELFGESLAVADAVARLRKMGEIEGDYVPAVPVAAKAAQGAPGCPSTRAKITEWFCKMGESFELSAHTVGIACNFLDRTLARRECSPVQFQLCAVTALLLAAKIEERKPITLNDLVVLSSGLFTRDDIRLMELEMLRVLKWRLAPPTVAAFADLLLVLEPRDAVRARVGALAEQFVNLSYVHDALRGFEPSTLAVASIICAYREAGEPKGEVERWTAVVKKCAFAYLRATPEKLMDAGVKLLSAANRRRRDEREERAPPRNADAADGAEDEDLDVASSFSEDESDMDEEVRMYGDDASASDAMDDSCDDDEKLRESAPSPDTVATEFFC